MNRHPANAVILGALVLFGTGQVSSAEKPAPRGPITVHVLDTARGRPGDGLAVVLERQADRGWKELARGRTNAGGRLDTLLPPGSRAEAGVYRLTFGTGDYFARRGTKTFYPRVEVLFEVADPAEHYHVPLLLSPFGHSTYRGS